MGKSTFYIMCPTCRGNTLLLEKQGQYFCAACNFNYVELKDDQARLDSVLIETMKAGGFGPLYAIALYERVKLVPPAEANQHVRQLAEKNNIDVFKTRGASGKIFGWLDKLFK